MWCQHSAATSWLGFGSPVGWQTPRIRELLEDAGLPSPLTFLTEVLSEEQWRAAQRGVMLLRERFSDFRFAGSVEYGLLMVPSPRHLDTRSSIPAACE